jgi:hypothetical protein
MTSPEIVRADPLRELERKMRRTHLGTCQHHQLPGSIMPGKAQRPLNGGGTRPASNPSRRGHKRRRHHSQRDTTGPGAVRVPSGAPADRVTNHRPNSPRLSRRKRKVNDGPTRMYDTNDPGGRKPKHPRHATEDQLDVLWHRWRQLADRRRRRT